MISDTVFFLSHFMQDFFMAFGLYTIIYLTISIFTKNQILNQLDQKSTKFISFIGIVFLATWIIGTFIDLSFFNEEDRIRRLNRMLGKYWFGFWLQPLLWISITQLLRFKKIEKNTLLRLIFSIVLIVPIEQMLSIYMLSHSDYLPSNWRIYSELDFYPSNIIFSLIIKIFIFLLFAGIFSFVNNKVHRHKT